MKRILLIEDDAAQRQLFRTALIGAGYEVLEAADGQIGLQLFTRYPCDLIITDIFMPRTDGIETIFDLKSRPGNVKIIAISGGGAWAHGDRQLGADEPLQMAQHFGADRILKKPIKLQELFAVMDELLNLAPPPKLTDTAHVLVSREAAGKRILVIEDDPAQRQLFKATLERAGYDVDEADNGEVGAEAFRQQPYDLVITDIFMPRADGIETIFDLRAQRTSVKIIAISGGGIWAQHGTRQDADGSLTMARKFGADRTMKKPIKLQQLVAAVDELLHVTGRLSSGS